MENCIETSGGTDICEKTRSLDLQTLYIQESRGSEKRGTQKWKSSGDDGEIGLGQGKKKRKSRKEVSLSSFEPTIKEKVTSFGEVSGVGGFSSGSNNTSNPLLGLSQKLDNSSSSLNNIALEFDSNIVQIPKRRRGLLRRKKFEGNQVLKQAGTSVSERITSSPTSSSKLSSSTRIDKLTCDNFVFTKVKREKDFHHRKENRSNSSRLVKEEDGNVIARNGDSSCSRENQRSHRKRKNLESNGINVVKKAVVSGKNLTKKSSNNLQEEDEENLEQNAARMLSSRFDPSWTGFSSKRKDSMSRFLPKNGVSCSIPSDGKCAAFRASSISGSESHSMDAAGRILRPRKQHKDRSSSRKRRHFYEILSKDFDPFWILNRKIKVLWPLDECWYFGIVNDYDPQRKLHHIKYEDRDEEWINIQNERFKLLLLPSELPGKVELETSLLSQKITHQAKEESAEEDYTNMDSQPIISWLARSSLRVKSSPNGVLKKQKIEKNKLFSDSAVDASFADAEMSDKNALESTSCAEDVKLPIVYSRRKFRQRGQPKYNDPLSPVVDMSSDFEEHDKMVILSFTIPLIELEELKFHLSFLKHPRVADDFWLFHSVLLLQHGTVVTVWPLVHFQMVFVDNIVGLSFLLFKGCLDQAVSLVILVLAVFRQPYQLKNDADLDLPVTSVCFRLSFDHDCRKQLVFALYSFSELKNSKWLYLEDKLKKECILSKHLPLAECTDDKLKSLQGTSSQLPLTSVYRCSSSNEDVQKRTRRDILHMGISKEYTYLNVRQPSPISSEKNQRLPRFALSFTAAPTFFLGLHLEMLNQHSVGSISFHHDSVELPERSRSKQQDQHSESECGLLSRSMIRDSHSPLNGISVEIPAYDEVGPPVDRGRSSSRPLSDLTWSMNEGTIRSPNPTAPRSISHRNRHNSSFGYLTNVWSDGKGELIHNGFGNGPKKPRTQVSYALPYMNSGYRSKHNRNNHQKRLPFRRIRGGDEKRVPECSSSSLRNFEMLACDTNVLVTDGDRGWRETGAQVVLQLVDHNEWRLAVKLSGITKYSYKAHQFLLPGTTNRYTHVMMWRGGKDWLLEFPNRNQWTIFKEMHEECYKRNIRAASVKNIPIPGVRLIEESDENRAETLFIRTSPKYFRQVETDVEMALNPVRNLYDMDSDDELWISKTQNSLEISEEIFEKTMDMFEKIAYTQQRDQFTANEVEQLMAGVGPTADVKIIYEYWRQKRQRKGMALIRQLQPPLWERYQQLLKDWEVALSKGGSSLSNGYQDKANTPVEKPAMFAFCLKPRGLEVPNKGSKQRSQKRFAVSGHSNAISGDHDGFHSFGRRLNGFAFGDEKAIYPAHVTESLDASPFPHTSSRGFSPREALSPGYFSMSSDGSERNYRPKLRRNKSKKMNSQIMASSFKERTISKRNGVHRWNMGLVDWPTPKQHQPEGSQTHGIEQLDGSELDEFRLRDASGAAQHALNMAKLKREKAQRLLYRADLAIHKAVVALMTAEAIKASSEDLNGDG